MVLLSFEVQKQQAMEKIARLLDGLEFGTIEITLHDSQITQIARLEKYRFALQGKVKQPYRLQSEKR